MAGVWLALPITQVVAFIIALNEKHHAIGKGRFGMNDFIYTAPPTKLIFGENRQEEFLNEIKQVGGKVLLVMGGSSFQKNGYYDELIEAFDEQKIDYVDFKGVTAPLLSKVREGAALCRTEKIRCVIGIGGGTCMDVAKAVAFAALQEEDVLDFFFLLLSSEGRPCLPIGEIVILSILVDTFSSRISLTMPPSPKPHNTACVLS